MKEGEFLKVNEHLKEVLNMNHNVEDLGFLGEAYPFFFLVIKWCILILVVMFLISGLSNLIINYLYGSDAHKFISIWNWSTAGSLGRIRGNS